MNTIKVTFKEKFHRFEAETGIEIPVNPMGITYIVGNNGAGKSSVLRPLRVSNDSLRAYRQSIFDGMTPTMLDEYKYELKGGSIIVEGLEKFTHVFALDAQVDDNRNFENSATATGLVRGGGLQAQRISRGENSLLEVHKFFLQIEKEYNKAMEADEGIDARLQVRWNRILENKLSMRGCSTLCVTHNPICMLSKSLVSVIAFDVTSCETMTPGEYIKKLTGADVVIND